ncbi:polysaccharide deacetylase family protein [Conexibacter woesei]|uniref:Polysaccharide deacetylase n=1 Tax=Conexibacter woesei (strain DSM 14684 / CCUG 47730 / CIP 108061 / JCM 11494 / NBRC 100937 / ID131577) TaxID=469383 RepID=D3F3F3_CONWI|nr:polysaccharide deacetylase [Conexibacter woesei]ADB52318.1 polysaccharide deacetylase [Conexibacter woesei DSM 14684]
MSGDQQPKICIGFDFDAQSVWAGSFGLSTPTALSRGEFGPRTAMPRILELLEREGVSATFFTPGHTIDTWPEVCRRILADGHELGHHGYMHESPVALDEPAERAVIEKGLEAMDRNLGHRPTGYRSPAFDLSANSTRLLLEYGFVYDSSMMADDFTPYWARTGDVLHMDRAFEFGREIELVEVPCSWSLDDFPQFELVVTPPVVMAGMNEPDKVRRMWLADLEFMVERVPGGVFPLTLHPQSIGRGARIKVLEDVIARGKELGARFCTYHEAATTWRASAPPPQGAR